MIYILTTLIYSNKGSEITMTRFDVLGPTHKGLRHGLTKLQFKASQLDFSDLTQVNSLLTDLRSMMEILDAHAEGEDKFLFPLLEKVNSVVFGILSEEHSGLEKVQENLLTELNAIVQKKESSDRDELGSHFVKNLNDFIAHYFIHLQTEELKAIPELHKAFDDKTLMQAVSKFATVTPPEVSKRFVEFLMPAINPKERVGFFLGLKGNVPDVVLTNMLSTAESVLPKEAFIALTKAIS